MEKVGQVRDGSTHKSGKGYYAEGTILFFKGKIIPLLLTLFSSEEESDPKKITRKNINLLKNIISIKKLIHIFDRGYDVANFMKQMIENSEFFIIRGIKTRSVICPEYYEKIKGKCITKMEKQNIFSKVEDFTKEMDFKSLSSHKHYEIAYKNILKKGENLDNDINDIIPVNLVVIRIINNSNIEGIEEDLKTFKNDEDFEKEFYFYTNLEINTTEDALVIFYLYLKRWNIETWFRYLKQVFGLERLKILHYGGLKNICNLLVISSYYLYDNFYNILKEYDDLSEKSLENIIIEEEKTKNNDKKQFNLFLIKYYYQYCKQLNLKITADSFAKFICYETGNKVLYYKEIIKDTG